MTSTKQPPSSTDLALKALCSCPRKTFRRKSLKFSKKFTRASSLLTTWVSSVIRNRRKRKLGSTKRTSLSSLPSTRNLSRLTQELRCPQQKSALPSPRTSRSVRTSKARTTRKFSMWCSTRPTEAKPVLRLLRGTIDSSSKARTSRKRKESRLKTSTRERGRTCPLLPSSKTKFIPLRVW